MRWSIAGVVAVLSAVLISEECTAGVVAAPIINKSNGHAYFLLSQNNWTGAEAEAISWGAHLATINSAAENQWVFDKFSSFGGVNRLLWIGLHDVGSFNWAWAGGTPVSYTNWAPSEPNDPIERWVYMYPSGLGGGRLPGTWNNFRDASTEFGGSWPIYAVAEASFTAQDVFTNEKSLSYNVAGQWITVQFSPTVKIAGHDIPVPLSVVEKLFGVGHFNWINEVTLPKGWKAEMDTGSQSFPVTQPFYDPIVTPLAQYVLTNANGVERHVGLDFPADFAPYYFNEGTGGIAEIKNWTVRDLDVPDYLSFTDAPTSSILDSVEYFSFRTELVGVPLGGGEPVHTGIGVTWQSNAINVADVHRLSAIDPSVLPPAVSGGVFNVEVFSVVPEPSTFIMWSLLGVLAITVGWCRRRWAA